MPHSSGFVLFPPSSGGERRSQLFFPLIRGFTLRNLQALLTVGPLDPFMIIRPSTTTEQCDQPPVSPALALAGFFPQGFTQRAVVLLFGLIVHRALRQADQPAGACAAEFVDLPDVSGRITLRCGRYQFFEFTSFRI